MKRPLLLYTFWPDPDEYYDYNEANPYSAISVSSITRARRWAKRLLYLHPWWTRIYFKTPRGRTIHVEERDTK